MVQIVNIIVLIDSVTSLFFILAFLLSYRNYSKTMDKGNLWLIISVVFVFAFIISISNVLEWAEITSALDPAEDFLNMLVVIVWGYIWLQLK